MGWGGQRGTAGHRLAGGPAASPSRPPLRVPPRLLVSPATQGLDPFLLLVGEGDHAQAVDGNSSPSGALGTKPRARALCLGQGGCRGVRGGAVGCEQAAGRRPRDRVLRGGREAEVTLGELLLPSWKIFQLWVSAWPFCSLSYGESRACYALPPPPRTKWQPGGTGGGCHSPPAAPGSSVHLGLWLGSQRNCRLGKRGGAAPPPNHLPAWWERPWAPPGQARRPDNGDQTLGALGGDGGLGGQRPLTGSPDWWCL